jgi:hypothetical protein
MTTKDQLTQHTSQISRLEQAMTALAEAQVKTENELTQLARETRANAAQGRKTQAALEALSRQFQAYLSTIRPV